MLENNILASNTRRAAGAWLLACVLLVLPAVSLALEPLLPQEQAFQGSSRAADVDMLHLHWDIADGYYLYRDKFKFTSLTPGITLGPPLMPEGEYKQDPNFGRMQVYRRHVDITIPYTRQAADGDTLTSLTIKTVSQGCADRGVCYAPYTQEFSITLPVAGAEANAESPRLLDKLGALGSSVSQSLGQRLGLGVPQHTFLPVDQAYILSANIRDGKTVVLHWDIADGYYLYRDKIHVTAISPADLPLGALQTVPGKVKQDEYFGRMEVYFDHTDATLPIRRASTAALPVTLAIAYQGCAEAGFCYPPVTQQVELSLPAVKSTAGGQATTSPPASEQDRIARLLDSDQAVLTALSLFGIGLLLAFTPCVFPMIPILSSIIVGQGGAVTTRRAFMLSLVYVLAMALTYTAAGVIAGLFGENLQIAFQSPWIIIGFSLVFIALALSMFGFYNLQMPERWQTRLHALSNRQQQGRYLGVAVMGCLSALIVGPCVAAPLAGILIYIGLSGNAWMGGFSLFMMSLGMGLPLLIIGTSAGKLLPRVGPWMTTIKAVFGVLLLAMTVWILERIVPGPVALLLWAALLIATAINMGALSRLEIEATGWQKLWKATGLIFLIYGGTLIIGAAGGSNDVLQPLKGLRATSMADDTAHASFAPIKGLTGLRSAIETASRQGRPVMLDFYADWCVECKKLERTTFSDPAVVRSLSGVRLLRADVTANDAEDQALLKQFGLFGPPAILFFDDKGRELSNRRLIGFLDADEFKSHIHSIPELR